MFDSTDDPVPGGKGAGLLAGDGTFDLSGPAVPTTLSIKLVGTMVLNNPSWSIAIITGGDRKNSNVYKLNDILLSSATVVKITRNRVLLKRISSGEWAYGKYGFSILLTIDRMR